MTFRENVLAILHYETFEHFPVVSFGYWEETLDKWAQEGHITREEAEGYRREGDNSPADKSVMKRLGFDFNWNSCLSAKNQMFPAFEKKILEEKPDGSRIVRDEQGLIVLETGHHFNSGGNWNLPYGPEGMGGTLSAKTPVEGNTGGPGIF